ncbi:MAG: multidrug efflux RND transporter permease subunit [Nitrospira sp.]|nr:multidrug efflux RND transporter permease subunit [Nitrospira sp.]MCP9455929.1 multidrug efflux RND transporter permease subunit [Nitrospira sp.]
MSHTFIDRPITASVVSIVIVVMGLLAMRFLPIAQFPEITPPVVQIDADYPGASAEVAAEAVARPIEVMLPGIDNLLYFESTSSNDGHVSIKLTFEIGTDPDMAQVQTQNRQKLAEPQLPPEVVRQGISVKKLSPDLVIVIALKSTDPRHDAVFLSNYATLRLVDELKRIKGVGDALVFGQQQYSMRIILNPILMARLNLMPSDIISIIREQNRDYPAGTIGREPALPGTELTIPIITKGRLSDVKEFEELIVRALPDGSLVRLKDVARVELGAQSYSLAGRWNSKPTTFILTFLAPGANALDTVRRTREQMDELAKQFPPGMSYDIPYDTTRFIEISIQEVVKTLGEAMVLVILVVYLFLQTWRATIIPLLAVPVSLIGTFIGLAVLGFSINTITLFGMVLAIGIVVDDAIVVVENVERHIRDDRLLPKEAAKRAMTEVTTPIISIVLVLVSVFVPVGFIGGVTGALYKEFAATIAISVTVSGFVALTLSPALCAVVLTPYQEERNRLWRLFDRLFGRAQQGYVWSVSKLVGRPVLVMLIFGGLLVVCVGLFQRTPQSFLPEEDQGYFIVVAQLPDGASRQRTDAVLERVERFFQAIPAVHSTDALSGQNFVFGTRGPNAATMFVPLVLWDERPEPQYHAKALVGAAYGEFAKIPEALLLAFNPPPIRGVGVVGGFSAQLQDPAGHDFKEFAVVVQQFIERAKQEPAIGQIGTNFRVSSPRLYAHVNRERAKALGIPISDIFDTLQAYFGTFYINDFVKFGRVYHVQTEADPAYRSTPQDLSKIYVRARHERGTSMVPLDTVVTTEFQSGPDPVNHFNGYNTAFVLGTAALGYSSGQALDALERVAKEVLIPQGYAINWSNISFQERRAGGQSGQVFAIGLLMVFLVLAAQFESWVVPFAVILAVPFAVFGALTAVWLRGFENDLYFQIGLVTLIGLSAKNAILIVEFANTRYEAGRPLIEAAIEGARLRFRPIIMTSMAFIFGMFPLVIAKGAGAASRQSIGTGVLGGMLSATFLAIFFVPLFYVLLKKLSGRRSQSAPSPSAERT